MHRGIAWIVVALIVAGCVSTDGGGVEIARSTQAVVGDGLLDGAELCDDGNAMGLDGCSASGQLEAGAVCVTCTDTGLVPDTNVIEWEASTDDVVWAAARDCGGGSDLGVPATCNPSLGSTGYFRTTAMVPVNLQQSGQLVMEVDHNVQLVDVFVDGVSQGIAVPQNDITVITLSGPFLSGSPEIKFELLKSQSRNLELKVVFLRSVCRKSICATTCGNGSVDANEECDDGNLESGDGCTSNCVEEPGYDCGGGSCVTDCGDGLRIAEEQCDDGGNVPGDGCDAACLLEADFECGGPGCPTSVTTTFRSTSAAGGGTVDGNWTYSTSLSGQRFPAKAVEACHGLWVPANSRRGWVNQSGNCNGGSERGPTLLYFHQSFFVHTDSLAGLILNVSINASRNVDDVFLNGRSLGIKEAGTQELADRVRLALTRDLGLVNGLNELTIRTKRGTSAQGRHGILVDLGEFDVIPNVGPYDFACATSCADNTCGNTQLDGVEACDDGNFDSGDGCSAACQIEAGWSCSDPVMDIIPLRNAGFETKNAGPRYRRMRAPRDGWRLIRRPRGANIHLVGGEWPAFEGRNSVEMNGRRRGQFRQKVTDFVSGERYALLFQMSSNQLVPGAKILEAGAGLSRRFTSDQKIISTSQSARSGNWTLRGVPFTASSQRMFLIFRSLTGPALRQQSKVGPVIDDVMIGRPSICTAVCGDGLIHGSEQCDTGVLGVADGCSDACQIEPGWECDTAQPTSCSSDCGDGAIAVGVEECDDENTSNGDGCSNSCQIEPGSTCSPLGGDCQPGSCGDGVVQSVELCDDGGNAPGDGCDANCATEEGYVCTGAPSTCAFDCGDGLIRGSEECDDGNNASGDGCSPGCVIEPDYECFDEPSACDSCGDGIVSVAEDCDDGNTADGDGCSSECLMEDGWDCPDTGGACVIGGCGDEDVATGFEECDDGNMANGDGCSDSCTIEPGYQCDPLGGPCITPNGCGNGTVDDGLEACDDGNMTSGDGCTDLCDIEDGWDCQNEGALCDEICGDLLVVGAEGCDDGNLVNGDGCSDSCLIELGEPCTTDVQCESGFCIGMICVSGPTCADSVKNQDETDVDCGGAICDGCGTGEMCSDGDDCASGVCNGGNTCDAPTCSDGVQNQDETDVDCGGATCDECGTGEMCSDGDDCASGVCNGGNTCDAPTCSDGVQNQDETDVDCGGAICDGCDTGEMCSDGDDCASGVCNGGNTCDAPTCSDGVQNQDETDVDCGGVCGGTCEIGEMCADGGDCDSTFCVSGVCVDECHNGLMDGAETDVDCGGGTCEACTDTEMCTNNADCVNTCLGNVCGPPGGPGDGCDTGDDADCTAPSICDATHGDTCRLPDGAPCSSNVECSNICTTDDVCGPAGGPGDPCDGGEDDDCAGNAVCDASQGNTCRLPDGEPCADNDDCAGTCVASTCQPEGDPGDDCDIGDDDDCSTRNCEDGVCGDPPETCDDGAQNQDETDVDCGGVCASTCQVGDTCGTNGDCESGLCNQAVSPPVCAADADGDGIPDEVDPSENGWRGTLSGGAGCSTSAPRRAASSVPFLFGLFGVVIWTRRRRCR